MFPAAPLDSLLLQAILHAVFPKPPKKRIQEEGVNLVGLPTIEVEGHKFAYKGKKPDLSKGYKSMRSRKRRGRGRNSVAYDEKPIYAWFVLGKVVGGSDLGGGGRIV